MCIQGLVTSWFQAPTGALERITCGCGGILSWSDLVTLPAVLPSLYIAAKKMFLDPQYISRHKTLHQFLVPLMGMSNPLVAIIPVHPDMITILYVLTGPLLVLLPPHPHLEGCQACTHPHGHLSSSALAQVSTPRSSVSTCWRSECMASSGCICCQALDVCRPTVHQGAPGAYISLHLHPHPREPLAELLLPRDAPAWPLSRPHHTS